MSELITKENVLQTEHSQLAAELTDHVKAQLPAEKNLLITQLRRTAHEIRDLKLAPTSGDGRGQACLSIPPIAYHRWNLVYPGCFNDKEFCDEWAIDNPETVLPGYKPRAKPVYFDIGRGGSYSRGANLYHINKAKVAAQIQAQVKAFRPQ